MPSLRPPGASPQWRMRACDSSRARLIKGVGYDQEGDTHHASNTPVLLSVSAWAARLRILFSCLRSLEHFRGLPGLTPNASEPLPDWSHPSRQSPVRKFVLDWSAQGKTSWQWLSTKRSNPSILLNEGLSVVLVKSGRYLQKVRFRVGSSIALFTYCFSQFWVLSKIILLLLPPRSLPFRPFF